MRLPSLLRKELAWGRRKFLALFFLFVALPAVFAYGTLAFENVLPTDTPVALVAQNGSVTGDDVAVARAAVTFFSDPVVYESRAAAFEALARERVYGVVTVPPGVTDDSTAATFHVYIDGSVVPYRQPSSAIVEVMNTYLEDAFPANISVERHVVGPENSLSEYLIPTFELALVMLIALAYLPYTLASEEGVFERLRVESSLEAVVAWKLAFFSALVLVPVVVFVLATANFGYGISVASVGAVAFYLLTFVCLAAVSMAITLATRFATWGRLCNVLLFFFLLTFSGLFYPAGFFSPVRRWIVRHLPTHYAMVAVRGYVLRGAPLDRYADWFVALCGVTLLALGLLKLSIVHYERAQ